jgi:hypothetical protein
MGDHAIYSLLDIAIPLSLLVGIGLSLRRSVRTMRASPEAQ